MMTLRTRPRETAICFMGLFAVHLNYAALSGALLNEWSDVMTEL